MIHDEICTYEVCKLAKEKGFPQESDLFYNRNGKLCDERNYDSFDNEIWCYAPTQSLLQRWLREEKGIIILINIGYCYENEEIPFYRNPNMKPLFNGYYYGIWRFSELNDELGRSKYFPTYELALEDALKYALENLVN